MEAVFVFCWLLVVGSLPGDFGFISILTQIRSAEPTMGGSSGFLGSSSLAATCSLWERGSCGFRLRTSSR